MTDEIEKFYEANAEELESSFAEYCMENDIGSFGLDSIPASEEIFWEYIMEVFYDDATK